MNSDRRTHKIDTLTLQGQHFGFKVRLQDKGVGAVTIRVNNAQAGGQDRWQDFEFSGAEAAMQELANLAAQILADINEVKNEA